MEDSMNTLIQLDVPYLPVQEYALRHCLTESEVNQMIEVKQLPMKHAFRGDKKRYINMVTLSRMRLFHFYRNQPDVLKDLAMNINVQIDAPYIPTDELARRWGASENSIRNMIRDGKLPAKKRTSVKGKHYINMVTFYQHAVEDSERPENHLFFDTF